MGWEVEVTDQFTAWYTGLDGVALERIERVVARLEEGGPQLVRPAADTISGSRHANMRELRVNTPPIRIFYAFDPRRTAILLIGGDKTNDPFFYDRMIPIADALYDEHLEDLRNEHGD